MCKHADSFSATIFSLMDPLLCFPPLTLSSPTPNPPGYSYVTLDVWTPSFTYLVPPVTVSSLCFSCYSHISATWLLIHISPSPCHADLPWIFPESPLTLSCVSLACFCFLSTLFFLSCFPLLLCHFVLCLDWVGTNIDLN